MSAEGKIVTKKAKDTLHEVDKVRAEMRAVILSSEKISRGYNSTLQKIEDNAEKERERIARKRIFTVVEPNLARRDEERRLKKLELAHARSHSQMQPSKSEYQTEDVTRKYVGALSKKSLVLSMRGGS